MSNPPNDELLIPREMGGFHEASRLTFEGDVVSWFGATEIARSSRASGEIVARIALPDSEGWRTSLVHGGEIVFVESAGVEVSGFPLRAFDPGTGKVRALGRFVRDQKRFPFGDPEWKDWFALGSLGGEPTITLWPGKGMVVAQTHLFNLETLAVGDRLPWETSEAQGRLLVTETEETDGVMVRDLVAGAEIHRVGVRTGRASSEPRSLRRSFRHAREHGVELAHRRVGWRGHKALFAAGAP